MGPYSMDLRKRVAAVIDEGEGSQRQVAKRFRVSVSFVTRLIQRRREAGTLAPKAHGGGPRPALGNARRRATRYIPASLACGPGGNTASGGTMTRRRKVVRPAEIDSHHYIGQRVSIDLLSGYRRKCGE